MCNQNSFIYPKWRNVREPKSLVNGTHPISRRGTLLFPRQPDVSRLYLSLVMFKLMTSHNAQEKMLLSLLQLGSQREKL